MLTFSLFGRKKTRNNSLTPNTQVYNAAKAGDFVTLKELLETDEGKSQINTPSHGDAKNSPLHVAASQGSYPTVKLLLANGANPSAQNKFGHSPLRAAVSSTQPCLEIVDCLLKAARSLAKEVDASGNTPLHHLMMPKSTDGLGDTNNINNSFKIKSGLLAASILSQFTENLKAKYIIAKYLINAGSDVNTLNVTGHLAGDYVAQLLFVCKQEQKQLSEEESEQLLKLKETISVLEELQELLPPYPTIQLAQSCVML
jgi:ankyrin repeat protein